MSNQLTKPVTQEGTTASMKEVFRLHGLQWEDVESLALDSCVPAMCAYGCKVEPDGYCEHGNESIVLHLGII
ncbi:MAG: hypothetical protein A2X11_10205 [Bacteroidetes bacterium GWE2_42_24]|nr:MAG: hypothetical protein A2X11_10205 [Bacteroidetes bacterium GWE2_42_24]OFY25883.1 MAG: hypothetical protein A2X09_09580 [Bacteroidetes bacterium GWF2_43_11]